LGEVYKALDERLNRDVAIKVSQEKFPAKSVNFTARFSPSPFGPNPDRTQVRELSFF
jgi:hypothetical protein